MFKVIAMCMEIILTENGQSNCNMHENNINRKLKNHDVHQRNAIKKTLSLFIFTFPSNK